MLSYRLRHRVEIQENDRTQNPSTGAMQDNWQTLTVGSTLMDSVPAEVLTGPGREFRAADALQAVTDARINLRWFPGLRQDMRILWDGRIYDITGMATDRTGRQEWRLTCQEGANNGG